MPMRPATSCAGRGSRSGQSDGFEEPCGSGQSVQSLPHAAPPVDSESTSRVYLESTVGRWASGYQRARRRFAHSAFWPGCTKTRSSIAGKAETIMKRYAFFIYGVTAHATFLGLFAYLAGFV